MLSILYSSIYASMIDSYKHNNFLFVPMTDLVSIFRYLPPLTNIVSHRSPRCNCHTRFCPVGLIHVFPASEKLRIDRRPHHKKKRRHSPTLCQAQIDNAFTSLEEESEILIRQRLQDVADSLVLPPDYLAELPNDLRLDLNDAAFELANGPLKEECGEKFGEMLMKLSQAWEKADTRATAEIASSFLSFQGYLTENVKFALGKRLIRTGRRFASMGQYGQGELQKIAKSMVAAGEALSARSTKAADEQKPIDEARTLKFGSLQVELTSKKAYIGSIIALGFGILSWKLSAGVQSIPEDSLQYANENALVLGKSLRATLLALCYSCTLLSAVTSVGLFLFGRQLSSEGK